MDESDDGPAGRDHQSREERPPDEQQRGRHGQPHELSVRVTDPRDVRDGGDQEPPVESDAGQQRPRDGEDGRSPRLAVTQEIEPAAPRWRRSCPEGGRYGRTAVQYRSA
jgi:hypothetical protein